jgi:hypothetical protein
MEQPGKIYNRGANQEMENILAEKMVLKLEKCSALAGSRKLDLEQE